MAKRATIKDVAEKAGVSHPVVSTVLRGKKSSVKCSIETRRRILSIAKKLNYTPNILARSFQKQKSYLIGVLFSGVNYGILAEFIHGFQKTLSSRGYSPIIFIHNKPGEEREYLERCIEREVDGLVLNSSIATGGMSNREEFSRLSETIPLVEIFGREVDDVPSLMLDFYSGALKATRYLIREGHSKIALYLHDRCHMHQEVPGLYLNAWQYMQGYRQAVSEAGLTELIFTHSLSEDLSMEGSSFDGAFQSAEKVLDHPEKPTAILCLDHEEVDSIMLHLVARDGHLDKQLHLVSPGNSMYSRAGKCKITTLVPPIWSIGQKAATAIFDTMNGDLCEDCSYGFQLIPQENSIFNLATD